MSKRCEDDKETYTFLSMGVYWFSHGKITLDNKSKYIEGKEIECPQCLHKFVWDMFYEVSPRYSDAWYDDPKRNTEGIPKGFAVEHQIQTPSKGDSLPRIAFIIKSGKLKLVERVKGNNSSPKDAVAFFSKDSQLTFDINEMRKDRRKGTERRKNNDSNM